MGYTSDEINLTILSLKLNLYLTLFIGCHFTTIDCWVNCLSHLGRVTHICISELAIIGSDNGLSPGRRRAIIWNNAGILLYGPSGTDFSEILIAIHTFSFKKLHSKMSSPKWRPFCLGLNVLYQIWYSIRCYGNTVHTLTFTALAISFTNKILPLLWRQNLRLHRDCYSMSVL